jgi:LmbE family N-acetylglucosaminyl deacetylase
VIHKIEEEAAWIKALDWLAEWQPESMNSQDTLVIAPHPDDETLGCGGLIARLCASGAKVRVVAVTDGEHAYPDDALPDDETEVRGTREREQMAALACLGAGKAEVYRLRLTDSGVGDAEEKLAALLEPLVEPTTHVIAPWPHDFHPDHEASGRAAKKVARACGAKLTYWFFWTWHRGTVEMLDGLELVRLSLSEEEQRRKREALACHASQLAHAEGGAILPEDLREPAYRPFEVYLPA